MLGVVLIHWLAGLAVAIVRHQKILYGKIILAVVLLSDIFLIGWFKYSNFTVSQIDSARLNLGKEPIFDSWTEVLLPIGISFFTFQAMSYLIDVVTGKIEAQKNPITFALYVTMFPQLVAGPIVRYSEIKNELTGDRTFDWEMFNSGLSRFFYGVIKKILIADQVSVLADAVFSNPENLSTGTAWIGALAYTIQIYFDFSAYSDMAIGLGRMFGFRFPENFNRPYSSHSITEFWRRWHMSLSRWFRDYLYIPLGGNRVSQSRTYFNLLLVFIATAIWHGANWTFLVWGLWHGLWLILERLGIGYSNLKNFGSRIKTLVVLIIGWVIFRSESLSDSFEVLTAMLGFGNSWFDLSLIALHFWWQPLSALVFGVLFIVFSNNCSIGEQITSHHSSNPLGKFAIVATILLFPLAIATIVAGSNSPFLYFRF